jgi:hypothetical protein
MSASPRTAANGHPAGSRGETVEADRAGPCAKAAKLLADQPDMTGADLGP